MLRSIILIVGLLAIGGGVGYVLIAREVKPPKRISLAAAPLVQTIIVEPEDVVDRFIGYGEANALRSAKVASEVAANVIERVGNVRAGAPVSKGQVIVRLDDREYQHAFQRSIANSDVQAAALQELEAETVSIQQLITTAEQELRVARSERDRLADLFENKQAAKKEYDFAMLAYQQARRVVQGYLREAAAITPRREGLLASIRGYEADSRMARLNIQRCSIGAPFEGRIESFVVDVGDRMAPGIVAFTIVDPRVVEIAIQLPALVYDHVRPGAICRLESESQPGKSWRGRVVRVGPTAAEQTRTFSAYTVVDSRLETFPLVPGTFVKAEVQGEVHKDAILLPRSACRDGRVFVVENGRAQTRSIEVDRFIADRALVSGNLKMGDVVIISHLQQISQGSLVRVDTASSVMESSQPISTLTRSLSTP